jgi:hypothetical protein
MQLHMLAFAGSFRRNLKALLPAEQQMTPWTVGSERQSTVFDIGLIIIVTKCISPFSLAVSSTSDLAGADWQP